MVNKKKLSTTEFQTIIQTEWAGLSEDLFQMCIARVAKRKPDNLRGRTELFK